MHTLSKRQAVDVLRNDKASPFKRTGLVDRKDVRVIEGRGGAGLLDKSPHALLILCHITMQHLKCPRPIKLSVVGEKDLAHTAGADLLSDSIAADCLPGGKSGLDQQLCRVDDIVFEKIAVI